jgi:hypothetical protein
LFLAYAMEKKIERRVHKGMTNIKSTTEVFCRGKSNEANTLLLRGNSDFSLLLGCGVCRIGGGWANLWVIAPSYSAAIKFSTDFLLINLIAVVRFSWPGFSYDLGELYVLL